ncbi:MAG: gamma-glutamyl-gamma-aminobutyrate hydrolase family protein [Nanoarchaeota archaeon]|nr:gamma-glutamyl-gamma-aminobutyrate hydrolase family protein [Nanoarchaeota archaeon]
MLEHSYVEYYEKMGLDLIPVPNGVGNIGRYFDLNPSLVILSGGNDISPSLYGGKYLSNSLSSWERDMLERRLVDYAVERQVPILGECRGMQFLNVYFGGKVLQNVGREGHVAKTHEIEIVVGRIFGKNNPVVNSYHNHCISEKELSSELKVFAKSSEGFVEGVYHSSLPIMGMMWHPERKGCAEGLNEKLIANFLDFREFYF